MYRYFGTKEGVLVADEFDGMSEEALTTFLDVHDPVGSLLQAVVKYVEEGMEPLRRIWRAQP